ncbi:MAG TPA: element excision factor XisH family protein [Saprospiraceae bacterium]|nr:element excision factor XisH family protein [Saprospiraceae bacterium]HMQ82492.1 element excision factor XisH family protein [Saprospiraceae bacterium]
MARDIFHDVVKEALCAEGWLVTHDPLTLLSREEGDLQTDIGAERMITAEKGIEKIAVEVKSFTNPSIIHDFLLATGQYQGYFIVMKKKNIERTLFLAMPYYIYERLNELQFFKDIISELSIKLLLFNPLTKKIESWKK